MDVGRSKRNISEIGIIVDNLYIQADTTTVSCTNIHQPFRGANLVKCNVNRELHRTL